LPKVVLGAILIVVVLGLFEVAARRRLWRVSPHEFGVAVATMVDVIARS
jgi:MFS superfamily sulfate permease-like transporter